MREIDLCALQRWHDRAVALDCRIEGLRRDLAAAVRERERHFQETIREIEVSPLEVELEAGRGR